MKYQIVSQGTYPVLEVTLAKGEHFVAEAGAMSWMDPAITCETSTRGGVLAGLKRSVLAGESFFQNDYSTQAEQATVGFVPGQPGPIVPLELHGSLVLEKGAYLCSTTGIKVDSKFEGLKGLFNEGLFVMRASGEGLLFFTGYGDVKEIQVEDEYVVDNGFAVAWDETLTYTITKAKKIRSFLFGNQLLLRFAGRGRLWVQSRSPQSLANYMHPFRRVKSRN